MDLSVRLATNVPIIPFWFRMHDDGDLLVAGGGGDIGVVLRIAPDGEELRWFYEKNPLPHPFIDVEHRPGHFRHGDLVPDRAPGGGAAILLSTESNMVLLLDPESGEPIFEVKIQDEEYERQVRWAGPISYFPPSDGRAGFIAVTEDSMRREEGRLHILDLDGNVLSRHMLSGLWPKMVRGMSAAGGTTLVVTGGLGVYSFDVAKFED